MAHGLRAQWAEQGTAVSKTWRFPPAGREPTHLMHILALRRRLEVRQECGLAAIVEPHDADLALLLAEPEEAGEGG